MNKRYKLERELKKCKNKRKRYGFFNHLFWIFNILIIISLLGYFTIYTIVPDEPKVRPSMWEQRDVSAEVVYNETSINFTRLYKEVVDESLKYYEYDTSKLPKLRLKEGNVWRSSYYMYGIKGNLTLSIGRDIILGYKNLDKSPFDTEINPEQMARMVLTHELHHFILWEIGFGLEDKRNEGVNEIYVWETNYDIQKQIWGVSAIGRTPEYGWLASAVLGEDKNSSCFGLVYSEAETKEKIKSYKQFEKSFSKYCGINISLVENVTFFGDEYSISDFED